MNLLHRHKWVKIFSSRWGTVDRCLNCDEFQTTMFNYAKNTFSAVPGNFLCASQRPAVIHVLCGSKYEFQHAVQKIKNSNPIFQDNQIRRLVDLDNLRGSKGSTIYLYGTWYENDLCQDPEFTRIMNGWL
jgi:hypothetical protein